MIEQRQEWHTKVIYLIADEYGSVQLELYKDVQSFGGTAWLWDLFVLPEHRRKGHARRLLKRAEEIAQSEGHKTLHMEWEEANTGREVLDWYIREGYDDVAFGKDNCLLEKRFV